MGPKTQACFHTMRDLFCVWDAEDMERDTYPAFDELLTQLESTPGAGGAFYYQNYYYDVARPWACMKHATSKRSYQSLKARTANILNPWSGFFMPKFEGETVSAPTTQQVKEFWQLFCQAIEMPRDIWPDWVELSKDPEGYLLQLRAWLDKKPTDTDKAP